MDSDSVCLLVGRTGRKSMDNSVGTGSKVAAPWAGCSQGWSCTPGCCYRDAAPPPDLVPQGAATGTQLSLIPQCPYGQMSPHPGSRALTASPDHVYIFRSFMVMKGNTARQQIPLEESLQADALGSMTHILALFPSPSSSLLPTWPWAPGWRGSHCSPAASHEVRFSQDC